MRTTALLAALSLVVQGCASPGREVTQTVRVETPGCAQTSCELSNDLGTWSLARTPGAVTVTTSHQPLTVSCRAEHGGLGSGSLRAALESTSGAGAVAGGVAGGAATGAVFGAAALSFIPLLGAIVVVTGVAAGAVAGSAVETSQQPLRYPELISVPMDCTPRPALVAGGALGLSVRGLTLAERRQAGVGERGAVLLISVAEGGAAAAAGLRSGDLILAAGGHDVGDAAALQELLKSVPSGTPLLLRLLRNGQLIELTVTRPEAAP